MVGNQGNESSKTYYISIIYNPVVVKKTSPSLIIYKPVVVKKPSPSLPILYLPKKNLPLQTKESPAFFYFEI